MSTIVGVDIGYETVKIIGLERAGSGWRLRGMNLVSIPSNPWQADKIDHQKEIAEAIDKALKTARPQAINGRQAMVALPESVIFSATFATPELPPAELKEALPFEIAEKLSLNVEEYQLDYETLKTRCRPIENQASAPAAKAVKIDTVKTKAAAKVAPTTRQLTIFAVAAKRSLINSVLELCREARLDLAGIDIKPGAIARSVVKTDDGKARLMIDMGVGGTGVSIVEGKSLRVTATVPWGTHSIAAKITGPVEGLREKAAPVFDELVHVSKFFENRICPRVRLEEAIISGTGASIPKIIEVFNKETGLPTRLAEPFAHIDTHRFPVPDEMSHTFADAIGLAMRPLE